MVCIIISALFALWKYICNGVRSFYYVVFAMLVILSVGLSAI